MSEVEHFFNFWLLFPCLFLVGSLLLGAEHGLADVGASESYVGGLLELEHGVHAGELGTGALEVGDGLDVDVGF